MQVNVVARVKRLITYIVIGLLSLVTISNNLNYFDWRHIRL